MHDESDSSRDDLPTDPVQMMGHEPEICTVI